MNPTVCQECRAAAATVGYGAPQLCPLCWCLATGDAPEDLAERGATSEADYAAQLAAYRATLVPALLARGVGPYYAARGYAWAQELAC
jgi:hypothetical protein